jgi:glycosyltransferase involved in cell wall biosynthesis
MERYAVVVAGTLSQLGYRVVVHTAKADQALAKALGVELRIAALTGVPKKLQDLFFFRNVRRSLSVEDGPQLALARVCARDIVICGGTHRGYLRAARKMAGPLDYLQIWMETQAYSAARRVVSHSELCRHELLSLYQLPASKIAMLYPPVAGELSQPTDESRSTEWRRERGLPLDKMVLLFPSMGHRRKGFAPLCKALSAFSDQVVLAVAGKALPGRKPPFVHYLGYVSEMEQAYRAADFTVLASYYEPFGLVGPESILCGTRLLFDENIGCLPAIQPEFVLTFSVWNQDSIRKAIAQALVLSRGGRHHISSPRLALRYNPAPEEHVKAIVQACSVC